MSSVPTHSKRTIESTAWYLVAFLGLALCTGLPAHAASITSPADPILLGAEAVSMPTSGSLPGSVATTGYGTVTYSGTFFFGFQPIGATSDSNPGQFLDISWDGASATAVAFELVNINVSGTLDVFDSANQLIESLPTPFQPGGASVLFFGATAPDIRRVRITSNDSIGVRNVLLNDVTVPEPAASFLVVLGLASIAIARRSRLSRATIASTRLRLA